MFLFDYRSTGDLEASIEFQTIEGKEVSDLLTDYALAYMREKENEERRMSGKVKINTKAEFIYSLESSTSVEDLFGSYLARGDIAPLEHYEESINKLTLDDIQTTAKKYFDFSKSTTVILRKNPKEDK